MGNHKDGILKVYSKAIELVFFAFLFGIFSLGRAFSMFLICPIFVTELLLLISLPYLFLRHRYLTRLPNYYILPLVIFFFLSSLYFFCGILWHNLFVFKDFVLCGYLLFFPLTFLILSNKAMLKNFIIILIASNFINLFIGTLMLLNTYPFYNFEIIVEQIKSTNIGLYYGMALSFLISFFPVVSKKKFKALMISLVSMNIYMLIFFARRTLWFALLAFVIYFVFIQRFAFIKILIKMLPFIVGINILLFYFESRLDVNKYNETHLISKFKTMMIFVSSNLGHPTKATVIKTALPANDRETRVSLPAINKETNASLPSKKNEIHGLLLRKDRENLFNMTWRIAIWKQSVIFGLKSPLFGRGFGVYPRYQIEGIFFPSLRLTAVDSEVVPAHNDIVTIFFKMGFVGLILFLFINIYTFLYGLRYITKTKDKFAKHFLIASLGAFIFWHTEALFFDIIDSPPTSIFLWIIVGLIFAAVEIDKQAGHTS